VELAEGKLKRAMELANKLSARYTLIVGDNEMAAGRYALKNMSSGEQLDLTRDEIAAKLAAA
jgi:histidyl-tRNA synthetase